MTKTNGVVDVPVYNIKRHTTQSSLGMDHSSFRSTTRNNNADKQRAYNNGVVRD